MFFQYLKKMKPHDILIDSKPMNWFAVGSAAFAVGAIACIPLRGWDPQVTLNVAGILSVLAGTIFIAGGVSLSRDEIKFLSQKIESKTKHMREVGGLLVAASRALLFGLAYIVLGSALQIISAVWQKL